MSLPALSLLGTLYWTETPLNLLPLLEAKEFKLDLLLEGFELYTQPGLLADLTDTMGLLF
jgi:hypothetical protein